MLLMLSYLKFLCITEDYKDFLMCFTLIVLTFKHVIHYMLMFVIGELRM